MNVTISIHGDKDTIARVKKLGKSLFQFQEAMKEIGAYMAKYAANEAIASQGQVLGESWNRLSFNYAARKAKRFAGAGPLIATGRMRDSFKFEATDSSVTVGNTTRYFKYHQSSLPRTKIPRRKMIGMNAIQKRKIAEIIETDVRRKIDNA